ncbi:related to enoyl-CoA hydratase [Serendipita indica DSM 11827]|uniref:Related to enoyl-CoA hydratase n=1 Tax=Serendipita indica (strain DSM 11827) TaxID=1109443 RepID=G4T9B8_SERID|nr:related to enoyl-CoA hydratase [Serendipita indica DSM 11827]
MPPVPQRLAPPATGEHLITSCPSEHVLLLTLNRPKSLNAMTPELQEDIERVLDWAENEPEVWVVIITGTGRAFCAGQDLKGWLNRPRTENNLHEHGFAGISARRTLTKPLIAAINGIAYGGGMELTVNCDLVVASEDAKFALPEVSRGVVAAQGGIPRLASIAGHQRASEMLLLGRPITAQEAYQRFNFVNAVVPSTKLMSTALEWAAMISSNSPDAVRSTKKALMLAKEHGMWEGSKRHIESPEHKQAMNGENIKEGLVAFSKKRSPSWKSPPAKL